MSRYFKTEASSEAAAIAAYHTTKNVFDSVETVTSYAWKRTAAAILWRLDGDPVTIDRMVDCLVRTGFFLGVGEITEGEFWTARSHGMKAL